MKMLLIVLGALVLTACSNVVPKQVDPCFAYGNREANIKIIMNIKHVDLAAATAERDKSCGVGR